MSTLNQTPKVIVMAGVLISFIITPWLNGDAMIIPKVSVLLALAAYLLPYLKLLNTDKLKLAQIKLAIILSLLITVQMLLVIFVNDSPFSQQFYGRTGRGLGFITYFSLMIILIVASLIFKFAHLKLLIFGILISCFLSSIYSILQKYGIDAFKWTSRTNGIIGTLGNPNFQSSFAAFALMPTLVYFYQSNLKGKLPSIFLGGLLVYTIYVCQSTQGYISGAIAVSIFGLLYFWYKNKVIFVACTMSFLSLVIMSILGISNLGPLSNTLYKYSIESRGEMWRTSLSTSLDNPIFGVGLDSFGDYSQYYKSENDAAGVNEWADNSHNYFLEYAATGGFPLAIFQILLSLLTLSACFIIQKKLGKFDKNFSALFCAWITFQTQSLISPATIALLTWAFIISGALIGISTSDLASKEDNSIILVKNRNYNKMGSVFLVISLFISYPLFKVDSLIEKSFKTNDALLSVKAVTSFPESVMNYRMVGVQLINSNLQDQALEVARAAVDFNPNAFSAWALLLACDKSSAEEKRKAIFELKRLDPHNLVVKDLKY